jgi:predicted MPP superfamily phosphohydrolase
LNAPLGVVAVLGNHDHWTSPKGVRAALLRAGITVLGNEATRRGPLAILGVDDAFSGHDDVAATVGSWKAIGGIPLVLTHTPDLTHKLSGELSIVLAGHTHCGQVVLPWLGPILTRGPKQQEDPLRHPIPLRGSARLESSCGCHGGCRIGYEPGPSRRSS